MNIVILLLLAAGMVCADDGFNPYVMPWPLSVDTATGRQILSDGAWMELGKMKFKRINARYQAVKYLFSGEEMELARKLDTLMATFPNAPFCAPGHRLEGDICFHAKKYDEALKHFRILAQMDTTVMHQNEFLVKMGMACQEAGAYAEAVSFLPDAAGIP